MKKIIRFTTSDVTLEGIGFNYGRSYLHIDFNELTPDIQDLISKELFASKKAWDCEIHAKSGNMLPRTLKMSQSLENAQPIRLIDHVFEPINYVTYQLGPNRVKVQRDGFVVYTAPSGQGKTYFAVHNAVNLCKSFDAVLYVNLELNENDIYNRFISYNIDIPDNLYIKRISQVSVLEQWAKTKGKVAFIVDNIDNLVSFGQDSFGAQLEFIKELDLLTKFQHHHALVLTQLVKDNANAMFDKNGDISAGITAHSLSGVKQITDQARSVFMSAFSEKQDQYLYKILKLGSGVVLNGLI